MKFVNIDLQVNKRGFRRFISSWLVRDEDADRTYLVDTGPGSTWPIVRDAVALYGGGRVDAVLLTHVHLDHAGAAPLAFWEYGAPVSAAPKGISHLLEPAALWKGSVETLGGTAYLYGEPEPLPREALLADDNLPAGFSFVETPGHASHHRCFVLDEGDRGKTLFAGEAAGIFLEGEEPFPYLRPATPPRFFPEVTLESIEKLISLDCRRICYAHFGAAEGAKEMLSFAKEQIFFWRDIVVNLFRRGGAPLDEESVFEELIERDPFLAAWRRMEPDIRDREREFIGNSIRGFAGAFAPKT
jgi:glyoxylase-like metal-dependent hydrolase (beta-lactamase superfamily II)